MRIYDYRCTDCDIIFEELTQGDEWPSCPRCESNQTARIPSAFAIRGHGLGSFTPVNMGVLGYCDTKEKYDRAVSVIKERFPNHSINIEGENRAARGADLDEIRHRSWLKKKVRSLDDKMVKEIDGNRKVLQAEAKQEAIKQNKNPGEAKLTHQEATQSASSLVRSA